VLLAYVANAGSNHVQVVDVASGATVRQIYTGTTPWRLVPSPGGRRLWVQHWSAATTAVVDLADHEITGTVGVRGPGAFTAAGDRFLSYHWPGSQLRAFDAATLEPLGEWSPGAAQVYDLAPSPDGERLYLARFDPMAEGGGERYAYLVVVPMKGDEPSPAPPSSITTGISPTEITPVPGHPFFLTADRGTDGVSLINELGDRRAVAACPAPRSVAVAPGGERLVVACWDSERSGRSRLVSFRADFTARPWPELERRAEVELRGGVVAVRFAPSVDRLFALDQPGRRLLELDPRGLAVRAEHATGDVPMDLVLADAEPAVRDRLAAAGPPPARRRLLEALGRLREGSEPFTGLSWVEVSAPAGPTPQGAEAAPVRRSRSLRPPARLRTEVADDQLRLAAGGWSFVIRRDGRFWRAPRQELASTVFAFPGLAPEEAVRHLAGDLPGSPFLRGGLAVDLGTEVEVDGRRYLVAGAADPEEPVSQLWLDVESGIPARLVERFPVFRQGHGERFGGAVETLFLDYAPASGVPVPRRLQRFLDGRPPQEVAVEEVAVDRDLAAESFDPARLAGVASAPAPSVVDPAPMPADAPGGAGDDLPGTAVPVLRTPYLRHPGAPHPPYNSNPPTSGPRVRGLAEWGVHDLPIPLELQVHNLEHGGVIVQYNCPEPCPELVAKLRAVVERHDPAILAPYPLMEHPIALTAWGRIDLLDQFDEERIVRFLEAYAGEDHHPE